MEVSGQHQAPTDLYMGKNAAAGRSVDQE